MYTIILNGEKTSFSNALSIEAMLVQLSLDPRKIAVEQNMAIIPHSTYASTMISEGDVIEIVHFIGGGLYA